MGGKASLILVMGFGFIFGYIAFRINELESHSVDNASKYFEVTTSHNIAVAGVNIALARLYQDTLFWNRTSDTVLSQQTFATGNYAGGSYVALFDYLGPETFRVISASRYQSYGQTLRDTVVVAFRKLPGWEILGFLQGFRGNDDTWITRDSMWGRVHFNGRVNVKGRPVYNDKVTVSKGFSPPVGTGTNQAIFKNGYETGATTLPLPIASDAGDTFPYADTVINGSASFQFVDPSPLNNNGHIAIHTGGLHFPGSPNRYYFYNLPGKNRVILVNGEVSVRGVVDGLVTVGATDKIWIDGNLTYAIDPRYTPSSDDMVGLVAMQDIILWNPGGQPELNVQSVTVSLDKTISTTSLPGGYVGVFRNYGALITQDRFDIASYSNSPGGSTPYINQGFYRRFHWDPRLLTMRPPYFPIPDNVPAARLRLVSWWENVRVPSN